MIVAAEELRGHSRGPKKTSIVQMAATSVVISLGGFPQKISERKVQVVAKKYARSVKSKLPTVEG